MKKVLVVLLSYKRVFELERAIYHLRNTEDTHNSKLSKKVETYFVIVDNSLSDILYLQLTNFIEKQDFKSNMLLLKGKNTGFSKSVNYGVENAEKIWGDFDYILLHNDDAFGTLNDLLKLIEVLEHDERFAIVGPTILDSNGRIWGSGGYFNYFTSSVRILQKGKKTRFYDGKVVEVDFITGCVMLIRKSVWNSVGPLCEDIFFYGEDLEYCMRVKKFGYKIGYVPASFYYHDIRELERINEFVLYNRAKSFVIVRRKVFSKLTYFYSLFAFLFLHTPYKSAQIFFRTEYGLVLKVKLFSTWIKGFVDGIRSVRNSDNHENLH